MMSLNYNYNYRQDQHKVHNMRHSMPSYQGSQAVWSARTTRGLYGWSTPQSPTSHSKNWSTSYIRSPPSSTVTEPGNSWVDRTSAKFGYYLDRGDGTVTRLVPADQLPPLNEIPRTEQRSQGMEILQPLSGIPPVGTADMHQAVTFKETTALVLHQKHQKPGKHDKEYCDKWVHEGVCAFTQQGCRYKHEMPYDKATQQSLGLFHGLPIWWKKRQAELQRQQDNKSAMKRHTLSELPRPETMGLLEMSSDSRKGLSGSVPDPPWNRDPWTEMSNMRAMPNQADFALSPCPYRCPYGAIQPPKGRLE